jgi:hypothetical protein
MTEENLHLKGDSTNLVKALETATTAFNTYGDTVVKVSASQQAALGKLLKKVRVLSKRLPIQQKTIQNASVTSTRCRIIISATCLVILQRVCAAKIP